MRLPLLLTLSAALFLPACNEEEPEDETIDPARVEAILRLPSDAGAGASSFGLCAVSSCHGADGNSGSTGTPLRDEVPELSDEQLINIVLAGYDEGDVIMPPQNLSDQEMADLLAYLRDNF